MGLWFETECFTNYNTILNLSLDFVVLQKLRHKSSALLAKVARGKLKLEIDKRHDFSAFHLDNKENGHT